VDEEAPAVATGDAEVIVPGRTLGPPSRFAGGLAIPPRVGLLSPNIPPGPPGVWCPWLEEKP